MLIPLAGEFVVLHWLGDGGTNMEREADDTASRITKWRQECGELLVPARLWFSRGGVEKLHKPILTEGRFALSFIYMNGGGTGRWIDISLRGLTPSEATRKGRNQSKLWRRSSSLVASTSPCEAFSISSSGGPLSPIVVTVARIARGDFHVSRHGWSVLCIQATFHSFQAGAEGSARQRAAAGVGAEEAHHHAQQHGGFTMATGTCHGAAGKLLCRRSEFTIMTAAPICSEEAFMCAT